MKSGNEATFLIGMSVMLVAGHLLLLVRDGWFFILWRVLGLAGVIGGSL